MDQQSRDPDFLKRLRTLIASYLESQEPLDVFATHFADLWREMTAAVATGRLDPSVVARLRREATLLRASRRARPEDARRIQDLIAAGLSRVAGDDKGAA
jgi:hypothetical protein